MQENSSLLLTEPQRGSTESLPLVLPSERRLLFTGILKQVSRSFYLTMRVLPADMREPVSLAYLLARAADSITDNSHLAAQDKLLHLQNFRAQLNETYRHDRHQALVNSLEGSVTNHGERRLLSCLPKLYALLKRQSSVDQREIISVVEILTRGMLQDLEVFGSGPDDHPHAMEDGQQLDRYCYQVAGCVGEFWTNLLVYHVASLSNWDLPHFRKLGMELGKALQLTNILRDVALDLRNGRCYLPKQDLRQLGLEPADLFSVLNTEPCRPALHKWIRQALVYYDSGEQYLNAIPRTAIRLRLAVAWPMLIGLRTLSLLANHPHWLNPACRIKVSRFWIYRMMITSLGAVISNRLMGRWFDSYRKTVNKLPTA